MSRKGFTLFPTPIGTCGIAWGPEGVIGLQLPEANVRATRARVRERFPGVSEAEAPPLVQQAIGCIGALLAGEPNGVGSGSLGAVPLSMEGVPAFHRRVYEAARTIPAGQTLSYGELAAQLGSPGAARAVGQALRKNPFAILVPCHRVLAAGGKLGGFTANGGVSTKQKLLALERGREPSAPLAAPAPPADPFPALSPETSPAQSFGFDPAVALGHLRQADSALARLIDTVGPFALRRDEVSSLFLALAEAIVYQQLTGKAAATIFGRVKALFPESRPTPAALLSLSDAALRGAGLSQNKLLSLRDLARRSEAGELPSLTEAAGMSDEALIERLTVVRGIGRWTVEMLLLFRLGRPDVLPLDDYGIRKGFAFAFRKRELPARADIAKRGARWAPYRSVASWYLWRAAALGDAARRAKA